LRILVYGDLLLDEYVFGRASRLSPEKPVPVVAFERCETYPGGAGNVARNLAALGCEPVLVAAVGDDAAGREARDRLEADGLSTGGLVPTEERPTPRKVRIHAGQHALVRVDYEDPEGEISAGLEAELIGRVEELAPSCGGAIVSDYRKGSVSAAGVGALARSLAGGPLVADPKGADAGRYRGATHLVPNEAELGALLGEGWDDAAAEGFRAGLGLEALIVTRSERGVRLYREGAVRDLPTRARQVFDVTGAGDTFAAALTAFLAGGAAVETAAELANAAAGIVVRRVGTATATRIEIAAELARRTGAPPERLDREAVARVAAERRAKGDSVVFTNGCFDLLHVGHIQMLEASRALGDCLIVGINTDDSVRRLKGDGRPILGEDERAEILGALSCVDHVVVFDEDTPRALIEAIRPDVLTKGADYETSEIVGADLVRSWGGRVERIDLVEGRSTSRIIGRILHGKEE